MSATSTRSLYMHKSAQPDVPALSLNDVGSSSISSQSRSASTPMSVTRKAQPIVPPKPNCDGRIKTVLSRIGFHGATKLSDTLQGTLLVQLICTCGSFVLYQPSSGSVWRASQSSTVSSKWKTSQSSVIKATQTALHNRKVGVVDGQTYTVSENIVKEQGILRYLTQRKNCPNSIVKFEQFFKSNSYYYLQMEDGGVSLFDFVKKAHRFIKSGELKLSEWQRVVRVLAKQMIECVAFIHSHNVCHFDISLENWLINDVQVEVDEFKNDSVKIRFVAKDIQIKLCDFGLAELFKNSKCQSSKFCGKSRYKSPECAKRTKGFDAKKNDVWCMAVCLFVICCGTFPFGTARKSDVVFSYVSKNSIGALLEQWNISHYVDEKILDLLNGIFQFEENRMSLSYIEEYAQTYL